MKLLKAICVGLCFAFALNLPAQENKPLSMEIILDSDTGNEVDDIYALARILLDTTVNVSALNATHWQTSHWAIHNTMENSHRLNQQLVAVMDLKLKTNRGGHARMYDWGDRAQHSAAAYGIIERAHGQENAEKLKVIALGALTNVASALTIDPSIVEKIEVFWLGSTYDFEKGIFSQTDFNCVMDNYALQYLLHSNVEMHILPLNVAREMKVSYVELRGKFIDYSLGKYLIRRWDEHLDPLRKERILWDVALVEAFLHPEWTVSTTIRMSKDNGDRNIEFYREIDADLMKQDFETKITDFKESKK